MCLLLNSAEALLQLVLRAIPLGQYYYLTILMNEKIEVRMLFV